MKNHNSDYIDLVDISKDIIDLWLDFAIPLTDLIPIYMLEIQNSIYEDCAKAAERRAFFELADNYRSKIVTIFKEEDEI